MNNAQKYSQYGKYEKIAKTLDRIEKDINILNDEIEVYAYSMTNKTN